MEKLKLYEAEFEPVYPTGCHLFMYAEDIGEAVALAKKTVGHTKLVTVKEVPLKKGVVSYDSGDY